MQRSLLSHWHCLSLLLSRGGLLLTLMVLLIQLASVVNSQVISIAGRVAFLLMVFNMALCFFFFFKDVCMYLLAVVGLSCCMWAFSSCGERGLLSCAWASHWSGFSCGGAGALGRTGFGSCRAWTEQLWLLGLERRLRYTGLAALWHVDSSGIRDRTWVPVLQGDSYPLDHQRSPVALVLWLCSPGAALLNPRALEPAFHSGVVAPVSLSGRKFPLVWGKWEK